jgi:CCR4-NOT transcription complex subunit 3
MRHQEAANKQHQQQAAAVAQLQAHQQQDGKGAVLSSSSGAGTGPSALDILTSGLAGVGLGGPVPLSAAGLGGGGAGVDSRGAASPAPPGGVAAAPSVGGRGAAQQQQLDVGTSYLSALGDSFQNVPSPSDQERTRNYAPQNPYPTPASYPSAPSPIFSNPAVFEKLGTDCLFFIFYYAQGTYQQYLAARELKKQSWRFHKKYMTWFQRHEEPKITTDEYEQGTYVYFDYETGWCTRIKTDFRFEYSYLEDSLQ